MGKSELQTKHLKTDISVIREAASLAFLLHLFLVHLFVVWALCSQFPIRGLPPSPPSAKKKKPPKPPNPQTKTNEKPPADSKSTSVKLSFVKYYKYDSKLYKND